MLVVERDVPIGFFTVLRSLYCSANFHCEIWGQTKRCCVSYRDEGDGQTEARRTGSANLGSDGSNIDDSGSDRMGGARLGPKARTVNEALAAIMDTPHPLDTLGEPGSYGFTVSPSLSASRWSSITKTCMCDSASCQKPHEK